MVKCFIELGIRTIQNIGDGEEDNTSSKSEDDEIAIGDFTSLCNDERDEIIELLLIEG